MAPCRRVAIVFAAWYLMMPPSMREESWACGGDLFARISHQLFDTGDEKICEQLAGIADISAPLIKWHETGSFESRGACEEARDKYVALPGSRPENVAKCFPGGYPGLTARGRVFTVR
jgi:hypothetical protein